MSSSSRIPDRAPEVVLDAQDVLEGLRRFRYYWHPIRTELPEEFRHRAATLLDRVPSWSTLAAGLLRVELDPPAPDELEPVEEDLALRIARALVDDGWIELAGAPIEAVISSIEHSGAIQSARPAS